MVKIDDFTYVQSDQHIGIKDYGLKVGIDA